MTPFAWSQPHDVNEHVAGIARELRALGHVVTVLAPSGRSARPDRRATGARARRGRRRDRDRRGRADLPALESRRAGRRAGERRASRSRTAASTSSTGSSRACPASRTWHCATRRRSAIATFFSPERLGFPPRRALREKLLARLDSLLATSEPTAVAAAERFPGDYRVISRGVDPELFRPAEKRKLVVIELHSGSLPVARAALRSLRGLPGWDALLLRTKPLSTRPTIPLALRDRVRVRSGRTATARAPGPRRGRHRRPGPHGLRAAPARGRRRRAPRWPIRRVSSTSRSSPLLRSRGLRRTRSCATRRGREGRAAAEGQSFALVARELDGIYREVAERRRARRRDADPLADRPWILADLHMHTSWSHDCSIEVAELLEHAEAEGLGAIAVTDHNVFGGALEAVELARGRDLVVIAGEEVKTDDQGEVIGLFLQEEIPRGMTFAETVAAIREQEGVVLSPASVRPHARDSVPGDAPSPPARDRRARGLQRAPALRGLQRRGDPVRPQVRPSGRRGLGRARAPGGRHGGLANARLRGPGGVHALAAHRRGSAPAEVAARTSRASSGWPRSRRRSARTRTERRLL